MQTNITVGDKEYKVTVVKSDEDKYQGLRNKESMPENEGMLFVWDTPLTVQMTMEDTKIPLDLIFIDENYTVTKVAHRDDIEEDTLIGKKNTLLVLEVNINSGIEVGDDVVLDEEDDTKLPVMKVLAPDGSVQMELEGGERIVSRRETKILIKNAKKAYASLDEKDYKRLGKYMFKVLKGQDSRDPEYVLAPK